MLSAVPPPVTVRVPAKINLHLEVGGLRDDGFHDLVTVFHAVSLFDEVSVAVNPEPAIAVHGEGVTEVPADETNLAWRAVQLLAERADRDPDVALVLRKGIPVAGGMAGGSADAAAALVGLSALWKLDLSRDELSGLAAELGSDVTFALHGGTALGTGRGEQIVPVLSRHTQHWVIALHRAGLPTPDGVRRARPPPRRRRCPPPAPSSRCWRPSRAATRASSPSPSATTCSPPPSASPPSCAAHCGQASTRARSPGSSPAPGRRARSCARGPMRRSTSPPSWRAWACAAPFGWRTARCRAPAIVEAPEPGPSWPPVRA